MRDDDEEQQQQRQQQQQQRQQRQEEEETKDGRNMPSAAKPPDPNTLTSKQRRRMKDKMRSMDEDGDDDDDDGGGGGGAGDGYDNDEGDEDENDEEEEEMEGDVIVDMGGLSFGAVRGTGENVATSDRWREELDAKGYTYYHDEVTGESVWVRPHVDVDDPYSSGLPSHEEYVDESGERCYHNVGTGVTLWAKDPKTNAYDPSQWVEYITSEGDKFHVNIVTEEHVSEVHSQIYRSESAKAQEQDMLGWHVEEGGM